MGLHLGLHWRRIWGILNKNAGKKLPAPLHILLRIISVIIAGYGLYSFINNNFASYMFLTAHFVFFDYDRPALLFFTDYISIMFMLAFLAYYIDKYLRSLSKKNKSESKS